MSELEKARAMLELWTIRLWAGDVDAPEECIRLRAYIASLLEDSW